MDNARRIAQRGGAILCLAVVTLAVAILLQHEVAAKDSTADPWRPGDVITPKQLADSLHTAHKPVVACVGFDFLFNGGHVPGAWYRGPASQAKGLKNLKAWAAGLDRKRDVVIYCGCCPWKDCPNIRPAFAALKAMGFTHLKVVEIAKDFPTTVRQGLGRLTAAIVHGDRVAIAAAFRALGFRTRDDSDGKGFIGSQSMGIRRGTLKRSRFGATEFGIRWAREWPLWKGTIEDRRCERRREGRSEFIGRL